MTNDREIPEIRSIIARNLRNMRTRVGKTQRDLGVFLGVTFQQIQKYEKGANKISAEDIYRLAGFLGVKFNDFFIPLEEGVGVGYDPDDLQIIRHLKRIKSPKMRNKVKSLILALEPDSEEDEQDTLTKTVIH